MGIADFIGFAAASLTTLSFLPQAIQVIKTKDTNSISLAMYVIFVMGVLLWLAYGLLITNYPMIIANFVTSILASIILGYKLTEGRRAKKN